MTLTTIRLKVACIACTSIIDGENRSGSCKFSMSMHLNVNYVRLPHPELILQIILEPWTWQVKLCDCHWLMSSWVTMFVAYLFHCVHIFNGNKCYIYKSFQGRNTSIIICVTMLYSFSWYIVNITKFKVHVHQIHSWHFFSFIQIMQRT